MSTGKAQEVRTGRRDIFGFLVKGMDQTPRGLPEFYSMAEEKRIGCCAVYWGCHGCTLPHGHTAGREQTKLEHRCACGAHPGYGSFLWGSGMTPWEVEDWKIWAGEDERQEREKKNEGKRTGPRPRVQGASNARKKPAGRKKKDAQAQG